MKLKFVLFCSLLASNFSYAVDKKVKFGTLDWEPYIGQELQDKGLINKILTAAYKEEGYKVELNFTPWARTVQLATQGEYDGLVPEYYDESRLKDFVYSDVFFQGPVGFLSLKKEKILYHKNSDLNKTYDELKKYKFGVVKGYINETKFDARLFDTVAEKSLGKEATKKDLKVEIALNDETNVKKLNSGKINLVFIDKYVASYFINKNFPIRKNEFIFLEPALQVNDFFIAFSKKAKDSDIKRNAFNAGMKKIKENGTLKKLIDENIYFN